MYRRIFDVTTVHLFVQYARTLIQDGYIYICTMANAPLSVKPLASGRYIRSWWTFGLQDAQTLPALSAVAPAGTLSDAAVFAIFRSGHLPEHTLDCLPGPPDSPAPANTHTHSICPWCCYEVTLPDVPSSAHDLPSCTSSIVCSWALQDRDALLSSNFVLQRCY
jgi:hypothetical protein